MAFQKVDFAEKEIGLLILFYQNHFTDEEIATYFGITAKALNNYLRSRKNVEIRQRIEKAKIEAKVAIRQALYNKARGTPYREGRPRVIVNGKVEDEGEPAQAAISGNLLAMEYWLQNCDETKQWRNVKEHALSQAKKELGPRVEEMSEKDLVDYVMQGIQEGLIKLDNVKKIPEETRSSLPADKIIDAAFREEKE